MKKSKKVQTNSAACLEDPTVRAIVMQLPSATDPNGSYTGKPLNENEIPVQDADDL